MYRRLGLFALLLPLIACSRPYRPVAAALPLLADDEQLAAHAFGGTHGAQLDLAWRLTPALQVRGRVEANSQIGRHHGGVALGLGWEQRRADGPIHLGGAIDLGFGGSPQREQLELINALTLYLASRWPHGAIGVALRSAYVMHRNVGYPGTAHGVVLEPLVSVRAGNGDWSLVSQLGASWPAWRSDTLGGEGALLVALGVMRAW